MLSAATEAGPELSAQVQALQGSTMGTTWSVKLVAPADLPLLSIRNAIQDELDRVVAQMSHWEPTSALSRFNTAPTNSWQELPRAFFDVLAYACDLARDTDGAYDPSAGALVDCWGFGPVARETLPSADEIAAAQARVGWQRLQLDRERLRALQAGGLSLDLSSIAKGYGVDVVVERLQTLGLQHYLVEVGGELRGQGCKPDGNPWWVALETPPDAPSDNSMLLALDGLAVATSGDYRRYFEHDAKRYAHTLDPRSGYPLAQEPALASVTVIHPSCMQADALATALTVLGLEAGFAYAEQQRITACFLARRESGFEERLSSAFAALLDD